MTAAQASATGSQTNTPPLTASKKAERPRVMDDGCVAPPPHTHTATLSLFCALYLTCRTTPQTRQGRSNSRRLVKVDLPEM